MKPITGILLLSLLTVPAWGQTRAQKAYSLAADAHETAPGNYRIALDTLRTIRPDSSDLVGENAFYQAMMTYQSFAGNYDSALYYSDKRYARHLVRMTKKEPDAAFVGSHSIRIAKDVLLRQMQEHQVVMLNEAHHLPSHRAFAITLLDELYQQGFRHIAMETLDHKDTANLHKRGYPVYESGFYQREPLFGELMRQALKKGFNLIAYEADMNCVAPAGKDRAFCNRYRDSIQAVNLARWVQKNPEQKLFVFAGYSHIYENTEDEWTRMAQFFQEMTGLDPFTIDQTQMNEHAEPMLDDPRYTALTSAKNIQVPVVALHNGSLWSHSKQVDATLFHPRYSNKSSLLPRHQDKSNRPGFYMLHKQRRPILLTRQPNQRAISSELIPENTSMIMAYYKNETGNRIPADVVEIKKDQPETILFLYPGAYEVVYLNNKGKQILFREMNIQ